MRIKRTKTGTGGPDGLVPDTRVHWARGVDRAAGVVLWAADEALAAELGEADAAWARERLAGPNAGTLEFFLGGALVEYREVKAVYGLRYAPEAATGPAMTEPEASEPAPATKPEPPKTAGRRKAKATEEESI